MQDGHVHIHMTHVFLHGFVEDGFPTEKYKGFWITKRCEF